MEVYILLLMRIPLLLLVPFCVLCISADLSAQTKLLDKPPDWAQNVADRFGFGSSDVITAEIVGNFNSAELLLETLNLRSAVTTYGERRITLRDILHSVDLNGQGDVAIWRVIGPRVVIRDYVRGLESGYKSKKLFYDFGVSLSPATICCAD